MATELQKVLRAGTSLEDLEERFGLRVYEHPTLPLVGFKYNQINTGTEGFKTHPVIRAARGTVLEKGTWNLVAQPFFRFYNLGEYIQEQRDFNWGSFTASSKEDGSCMIVYHYDGEWHVNTSGSFGLDECGFSGMSWRELFWDTVGVSQGSLNPEFTYCFELCTIFNKIVRQYESHRAYLIGIHKGEYELLPYEVNVEADRIGARLPEFYQFISVEDIESFLKEKEESDPTFEGVVIRDNKNLRIKIKSKTYLALHHLADNGNIANPKNIIPFVLAGEIDEVLSYFPELSKQVSGVESLMGSELENLETLYEGLRNIESQKEFALAIVGNTKFPSILFTARKSGSEVVDVWRESADLIHKVLFK